MQPLKKWVYWRKLEIYLQFLSFLKYTYKPMAWCKTAVTPLLTPWSYCSLALSHQNFSFNKMHLKMLSAKWWPFCSGLAVSSNNFQNKQINMNIIQCLPSFELPFHPLSCGKLVLEEIILVGQIGIGMDVARVTPCKIRNISNSWKIGMYAWSYGIVVLTKDHIRHI